MKVYVLIEWLDSLECRVVGVFNSTEAAKRFANDSYIHADEITIEEHVIR